jgi:ligand-binding sensor protein
MLRKEKSWLAHYAEDLSELAELARDPLRTIGDELSVGIGILDRDGKPIAGIENIGFCAFCRLVRTSSCGRKACLRSDRRCMDLVDANMQTMDSILDSGAKTVHGKGGKARRSLVEGFRCDFKLIDICYPIQIGGKTICFLFMGQIRDTDLSPEVITMLMNAHRDLAKRKSFEVSLADFIGAYTQIPRRQTAGNDVFHIFRILREFARFFSKILQSRHDSRHASEFAARYIPDEDFQSTLKGILDDFPSPSPNGSAEVWLRQGQIPTVDESFPENCSSILVASSGRPLHRENGAGRSAGSRLVGALNLKRDAPPAKKRDPVTDRRGNSRHLIYQSINRRGTIAGALLLSIPRGRLVRRAGTTSQVLVSPDVPHRRGGGGKDDSVRGTEADLHRSYA